MSIFRPYFMTVVALAAGIIAAWRARDVTYDPEPAIRLELPDRAGPWRGEKELCCQNPKCEKLFLLSELNGAKKCPSCGGALGDMMPAEKELLPPDTYFRRSIYSTGDNRHLAAAIVLSGKDRASIHRPEVCFTSAGNDIVSSEDVRVNFDGRRPLSVHVIILRAGAGDSASYSFFSYWFVARGHETPSHVARMFWMAADRIFHNVSRRWAYVSVSGAMTPGSDSHLGDLRAFLRDFVPQLAPR